MKPGLSPLWGCRPTACVALVSLKVLLPGWLGAAPPIVFGPAIHYSIHTNVNRLCTGDFNADHRLDLAALTGDYSGGAQITIWTNNGSAGFVVCTNHSAAGLARVIAPGDVNNDGNVDLVTVNYLDNSISAFLGNGDGTFHRLDSSLTVNSATPGLALGDFNGDGWLDAAVSTLDIRILLGDGSGNFTLFTNYPADFRLRYAVAAVDLNANGELDLVTANYSSSSASVFLGQGGGTFAPHTDYGGDGSEYHYSVVVGDFNGDTLPDLATANQYNGSVSVRLNDGNGAFGPETRYRIGPWIHSVVVADFNLDGHLDLAADLYNNQNSLAVWPGNGDGTFGRAFTNFTSNNSYPNGQSLVAGDFDGDGLMDLATTRGTTNAITVRLNQSVARLLIERAGNQLVLSWPNWNGYVLQSNFSPNVANPNAWQEVFTPTVILGNRKFATNSIDGQFQFYRLRRPLP